jgi:predicted kinase
MTTELIVFVGLQASGKSSFYRAYFAGSHDLVSKDCFRSNRNPGRRQLQLIEEALRAGRPVVIDNTNPTRQDRAELIALGRTHQARILGYYFASGVADCLERNRRREGKARVPDVALYATRKRLEVPSLVEGFDELFHVRLLSDGRFEVLAWVEGVPTDAAR